MPIILIFLLLFSCGSKQPLPTEPPAIPVRAIFPVIQDVTVYLDAIGTLQAPVLMEIQPQVEGMLSEVLVAEGQWVDTGAPLFKIDAAPYAHKVQEAEAQLAIERTELKAAQKKLDRFRTLAQKDLVSQLEWDELETKVAKAEALLQLHQARLDSARLDLENCTLKSPLAGRVGKHNVHPGLLVARGATLASIAKLHPLFVEFTVTEKEASHIRHGGIELHLLSAPSSPLPGTITFLDNQFDGKSGQLLIRAKVPNEDLSLRPGQSVRVRIPVSTISGAVLIPQKTVRRNQEGPYVYVVQADKTVAIRPLILGDEHGSDFIIREGLSPSEQIILDGHLRLSPGIKVDIQP